MTTTRKIPRVEVSPELVEHLRRIRFFEPGRMRLFIEAWRELAKKEREQIARGTSRKKNPRRKKSNRS